MKKNAEIIGIAVVVVITIVLGINLITDLVGKAERNDKYGETPTEEPSSTYVSSVKTEREVTQRFLDLWLELVEKENKTDREWAEQITYAQILCERAPELRKYIDPVTGEYVKETTKPTQKQTSKPTPEATPKSEWYGPGMYKVGVDIPEGIYFVRCTDESCYYAVTSDSTGELESIVMNDNISTFTYVSVENGQYFRVIRGEFIPIEKAPMQGAKNGVYAEGTYLVGRDIPAGEYKIECTSDEWPAYVEVRSDCGSKFDSIVMNDNFEGARYITVEDGQYFTIIRGIIHEN